MVTSVIMILVYSFYMMSCFVCTTYDWWNCPQANFEVAPSWIWIEWCSQEDPDPICKLIYNMDKYRIIKLENWIYIVQWLGKYGSRVHVESPAYETLEWAEARIKEFQLQDAARYEWNKFEVVKTYSVPELN